MFNDAYDLLNAIYVDVIISTLSKTDERSALLQMAERRIYFPSILVGDRGYGGWKVFARLHELGRSFVIREKDLDSQGIFRSLNFSDDSEFDAVKTLILTNKQTKETLNHPELYRRMMSNQDFRISIRELLLHPETAVCQKACWPGKIHLHHH